MLQLLVSVSLDSFKQCTQSLLLPLSEQRFLLLNIEFQLLGRLIGFFLLYLLALHAKYLRLLVPLGESQFLYLVFHLHQFA